MASFLYNLIFTNKLMKRQESVALKGLNHYYEVLVRNQWCLPKITSGIVTYEYLNAVRHKQLYCPKYPELKLRACFDPPTKQLIVEQLERESRIAGKNLGFDREAGPYPDKKWMLKVLSTLNPEHEFFSKAYCAPPKNSAKKKKRIEALNPDGLFDDLEFLQYQTKYAKRRGDSSMKLIKSFERLQAHQNGAWVTGAPISAVQTPAREPLQRSLFDQ